MCKSFRDIDFDEKNKNEQQKKTLWKLKKKSLPDIYLLHCPTIRNDFYVEGSERTSKYDLADLIIFISVHIHHNAPFSLVFRCQMQWKDSYVNRLETKVPER